MLSKRKCLILGLRALLVSPGVWAGGTHGDGHHGDSPTKNSAGHGHGSVHTDDHGHAQGGHAASVEVLVEAMKLAGLSN